MKITYFRFISLFLAMLLSYPLFAQSKKDIRNAKIASETTTVTQTDNGKDITYKETYTIYDKNGNVTEQTEYNKEGAVKRKESNKYNADNDKTEEVVFDAKEKTTRKTSFTYNVDGSKTGEIEYDEKGIILKQSTYTYNNKGLKTEKKTFDGKKKLLSTKKYNYTTR
ncbi:MAG: hypothetical protein WCO63_01870 [Bacteroidota bacterium]